MSMPLLATSEGENSGTRFHAITITTVARTFFSSQTEPVSLIVMALDHPPLALLALGFWEFALLRSSCKRTRKKLCVLSYQTEFT